VRGADLGHGVLLRAAPLIRGHRREQQVQLAVDKSSGADEVALAEALAEAESHWACGGPKELALEIEVEVSLTRCQGQTWNVSAGKDCAVSALPGTRMGD
jgi:hypothetical protein